MSSVTDIHWCDLGPRDAPSVVFCHGMGLSHLDLMPLAQSLAGRWRVILWDMPGHGQSGPLPSPCALDSFTDALEAVLDRLEIERPILVGFSFGGMVAQSLLHRGNHPIAALVAYGCYAPFLAPSPAPREVIAALTANMIATPWDDVKLAFAQACCLDPDGQARLLPTIDRVGATGLVAMTGALFEAFAPDPAFKIAVPLLVLRGALDVNDAALVASADALIAAAMPDASQIVIDGAGHAAHLDEPDAVELALLNFLDNLGVNHTLRAIPE